MDEVWSRVKRLKGQTLHTTKQRKAFDVVEVDDNAVFIRPHDTATPYSPRRIQRRSIEEAYWLSRPGQALTPSVIQKAERLPRDAAYSAAYIVTIATKLTQGS